MIVVCPEPTRSFFMCSAVSISCLRAKIEAMIRKGGIVDPDCPEDPASMRFWCWTGAKYQDRERTKVSMEGATSVKATPDAMASLLGAPSMSMSSPQLALPASASKPAGQPSLGALVGLATGGNTQPAEAKAKAKVKAKAKSGGPKQVTENTPEEHRKNARALFLFN